MSLAALSFRQPTLTVLFFCLRQSVLLRCLLLLVPSVLSYDVHTTSLRAALTFDIPPYIQNQSSDGLEPAILRAIFVTTQFQWLAMSYNDVETAISPRNVADVALAMTLPLDELDDDYYVNGTYYSQPFIAFTNAAFVKTSDPDDMKSITSIAQLNDFGPVFTWEGALTELGDEFEQTFSNSSNSQYTPVGNQTEQVLQFWETPNSIIVIDSSIFAYYSLELLGHNESEYVAIDLFPPVTTFAVGFASIQRRNVFERGMDDLCEGGSYEELLQEYSMKYEASIVCDDRMDIVNDENQDNETSTSLAYSSRRIAANSMVTPLVILVLFALTNAGL